MTDPAAIQAHWNERAQLGKTAGTQDLILTQLEQRELVNQIGRRYQYIAQPRILEVGCGLGETARLVADTFPCARVRAIDSAPEMIAGASAHARVEFAVADVLNLPLDVAYDMVYSQRCLINLETWERQQQAIDAIAGVLVTGGRFLMCEHSQDGLDALNEARAGLGLSQIQPEREWNRYFAGELYDISSLQLVKTIPFSATYYFLSRLVNAKLAQSEGHPPAYDAPINQLALIMSAACVDAKFAQGRLWIWEKA